MKKLFVVISLMLMWCLTLVSCNTNTIDTNSGQNINNTEPSTNNQDRLDTLVPNDNKDLNDPEPLDTIDTSIQVEYNPEREATDNEFPFDNIVLERNGYDVVAAGKYYGNDFDTVKYYGSYYRIIDNYEDFSKLTQWGQKIDESMFDGYFVLVLHTYKNQYVYYSYLDEKGEYVDFGFNTSSNDLKLTERWMWNSGPDGIIDSNGNEIELPIIELHRTEFPADVYETIYLLISKEELPNDLPINGEIDLKSQIIELE